MIHGHRIGLVGIGFNHYYYPFATSFRLVIKERDLPNKNLFKSFSKLSWQDKLDFEKALKQKQSKRTNLLIIKSIIYGRH